MKKSEITRIILHSMRSIYYPNKEEYLDWMGYRITDNNRPTYHHIIKKEDLKKENKDVTPTVYNGAYLGKKSHEKLHLVEILDKDLYDCWNYVFKVINQMRTYPIPNVWKMVFSLQEQTEELLHQDTKVLIKKKRETARQKNVNF